MSGKAIYPWEPYDATTYDLVYLSLGAGVQSSTLLALSALGLYDVPKVDVAIFADTQDEPKWVYNHLWQLVEWVTSLGVRIEIVTAGQLSQSKCVDIPAFSDTDGKAGLSRRYCTHKYKIVPINRRIRELLGLSPKQRSKGRCALSLQGISSDEMTRMKDPIDKFVDAEYPLVRLNWSRADCLKWWQQNMPIPTPHKSACVYCPYRSNKEWRDIRDNDLDGWQAAIAYDKKLRSTESPLRKPVYVHQQLVPLDLVDLDLYDKTGDLYAGMLNECDGMCGI